MAGEKCEEDDDCFSGNCKENQVTEEKECEVVFVSYTYYVFCCTMLKAGFRFGY